MAKSPKKAAPKTIGGPIRKAAKAPRTAFGRGGGGGGTIGGWLRMILLWTTVGASLAVAAVFGVLYRGALDTVDERLKGDVWSLPGHVWSGPIEAWPGLRIGAAAFADDLVAAGYARVADAQKPGDFQLSGDALLLKPRTDDKKADVLVTFKNGAVASVTPGNRLTAERAVLATLRGASNENRSPVSLADTPKHMQQAVLAMEDARFFEHGGIDPIGIARALWVDLLKQELAQGGSTLTQQLAKNLFLSQDRTAGRKLREVLLAFALERRLSKEEILRLYLSEIYLGQAGSSAVCGVDAASRAYFGKPIGRVELGEAATLAGIIASPNAWSPIRHPEEAKVRRDLALQRMVDAGFIDEAAAAAARAAPLVVNPAVSARQAPWATDHAVEEVEADLGAGAVARGALEVQTTLVPGLQHVAEAAMDEGMAELVAAYPKLGKVQAALVVVRASDGGVVAMVGGRDYANSNYNRAVDAVRQIGSTVKPLTALAAFESDRDLSTATRFDDAPLERTHDGKSWTPTNYDGSYLGPISLRRAMSLSRNIPAVLLAERIGLASLRERWRGLGLPEATDYPSAALGGFGASPVQLAGAYAALAGKGSVYAPRLVTAVEDARGTAAWTVPDRTATATYSTRAQWLTNELLRSVMVEGTGKGAAKYGVGPGARGKSGTTNGYKDGWFAGTVGGYAVVVWVGFDQNEPIGITGSKAALPVWARFVAGTGLSKVDPHRSPPAGVVAAEVCEETDLPPCPRCDGTRTEYYSAGHVPEPDCSALPLFAPRENGIFARLGRLLGLDPEAPPERGNDDDARGPGGTPVPR